MGFCLEDCAKSARFLPIYGGSLRDAILPRCLHAFAVRRQLSAGLVAHTLPLDKPIDEVWARLLLHSRVAKGQTFIVVPPIFLQARDLFVSETHSKAKKEQDSNSLFNRQKCDASGRFRAALG